MTSSQLREEKRSRVSASLPGRGAARIIAISGTTPEPPRDEQQRASLRRLPDEVAADRTAQLDPVAGPELVGEVRRHLAVVEPLDRELDASAVGRRGDRVAALGLVAVLGRQPDVDVLAGAVPGPAPERRRRAS